MASRGQRISPTVNIIDLTFDDNPPPIRKKKGKLTQDADESDGQVKESKATASGVNEETILSPREMSAVVDEKSNQNESQPTNSELLSFALRMNSHQIAKEILLDEEDIKWVQSTSSFLTGNTDLVNAGSIRRELSERQMFLKAVEEVERARARIIYDATKQPHQSAAQPSLERGLSRAESEVYSEKYESDFSADSIDVDDEHNNDQDDDQDCKELLPVLSARDQRIFSDLTEDYEDDYEPDDSEEQDGHHHSTIRSGQIGPYGRQSDEEDKSTDNRAPSYSDDAKQQEEKNGECEDMDCEFNERRKENEEGDSDVFEMLNGLVDHGSESDSECGSAQRREQDEHEQSILKRLKEAHEQRSSPSHLSRHTSAASTNYFDSPQQRDRERKRAPPQGGLDLDLDLDPLDLDLSGEHEHEEYSVQYSQLKSSDSQNRGHHFPIGNKSATTTNSLSRKSFRANQTDDSKYSKFSASTQSSSPSHRGDTGADSLSFSGRGASTMKNVNENDSNEHDKDNINFNDDGGIEERQLHVEVTRGEFQNTGAKMTMPLPTPGRLSENNNMDFMVSGGLNEWLVMNMKENTSTALRSLNKHVDNHHIRSGGNASSHFNSSSTGEAGERPYHRDLKEQFSVCAEVYQHYLAEALELKEAYDNEARVRHLAHAFTGNVLQQVSHIQRDGGSGSDDSDGGDRRNSESAVTRPHPKGILKRRHSAKAKDDFDLRDVALSNPMSNGSGDTDIDTDTATAMFQSDSKKRFYRQSSVGQKLTSASMQIECVSKLEGGRNEEYSGDKEDEEFDRKAEDEESIADSKQHADAASLRLSQMDTIRSVSGAHNDQTTDEATLMSQSYNSYNLKRNEIRKKNRRALFAAMHLGEIAGKLVMERSQSSAAL